MKLFIIVLYLGMGPDLMFMHPVQVTEEQCEDPHAHNLFEHKIIYEGEAQLDRYFYKDYVVFGSYCAGLLGAIENK